MVQDWVIILFINKIRDSILAYNHLNYIGLMFCKGLQLRIFLPLTLRSFGFRRITVCSVSNTHWFLLVGALAISSKIIDWGYRIFIIFRADYVMIWRFLAFI